MSLAVEREEVTDEDQLLRRIHPSMIVPDGQGSLRISSAAFKDPEMSGDSEAMLKRSGLAPEWSILFHPSHSLARVNVKILRDLEQEVVHVPLIEDPGRNNTPNRFHIQANGTKRGSVPDRIRKASNLVVLKSPP